MRRSGRCCNETRPQRNRRRGRRTGASRIYDIGDRRPSKQERWFDVVAYQAGSEAQIGRHSSTFAVKGAIERGARRGKLVEGAAPVLVRSVPASTVYTDSGTGGSDGLKIIAYLRIHGECHAGGEVRIGAQHGTRSASETGAGDRGGRP